MSFLFLVNLVENEVNKVDFEIQQERKEKFLIRFYIICRYKIYYIILCNICRYKELNLIIELRQSIELRDFINKVKKGKVIIRLMFVEIIQLLLLEKLI